MKDIKLLCRDCIEKQYPDKGTFEPEIGDIVKLLFIKEPLKSISEPYGEHMWCLVAEKLPDGGYIGILDNDTNLFKSLKSGDAIRFAKEDVEMLRKPNSKDRKYHEKMMKKHRHNLKNPKTLTAHL